MDIKQIICAIATAIVFLAKPSHPNPITTQTTQPDKRWTRPCWNPNANYVDGTTNVVFSPEPPFTVLNRIRAQCLRIKGKMADLKDNVKNRSLGRDPSFMPFLDSEHPPNFPLSDLIDSIDMQQAKLDVAKTIASLEVKMARIAPFLGIVTASEKKVAISQTYSSSSLYETKATELENEHYAFLCGISEFVDRSTSHDRKTGEIDEIVSIPVPETIHAEQVAYVILKDATSTMESTCSLLQSLIPQ